MGLLRFLLAVSVLIGHTPSHNYCGLSFVGGQLAVEAFFIISGFYIALILNEKYIKVNNSYWLFISNRFLRIFPYYWLVLIITLVCALSITNFGSGTLVGGGGLAQYYTYGSQLSLSTWGFLIFTHIFIFLQDAAMFLGLNLKSGNLFFAADFNKTSPMFYRFLLLPQAWSIGLELTFYIIAPLIVRRKPIIIIVLLLGSMLLKGYALTHGLSNDPWTYRFFPFELMYFLLGVLGYTAYKRYLEHRTLPKYLGPVLYAGLAVFTITFSSIPIKHLAYLYLLCVFISVPILFKYTQKFKIDRFCGELSYPIYLSHFFMINLFGVIGFVNNTTLIILGTIILSIAFVKLIGDGLERLRQGRVIKQKGVNAAPDALSVTFNK